MAPSNGRGGCARRYRLLYDEVRSGADPRAVTFTQIEELT
jgi:hypothetical protein